MNNAKVTTFRNKITVKHGFSFKGEYFSTTGRYIILTPGNFKESGGFKCDMNKAKFYTGEVPKDYICNQGDLIVAMTEQVEGLLGSTAIVPENNRFLHNQRIGLITSTDKEIDKVFLYYLFNTKNVRRQIRLSSSGSKVKHTSPDRIYDVTIILPPYSTQTKIAAVLSAIDAKLEINDKINTNLELMAKTIYDYWFVQFDFPNVKGNPYKMSGSKMVWNDKLKREIPEGWQDKQLSSIFTFQKGSEPGSSEYKDYPENSNFIKFFRVGDIDTNSLTYVDSKNKEYVLVNERDVIVTFDGSIGKIGFGLKGAISGGLRRIYDQKTKFDSSLVFFIFRDKRILATIHKYATGSILLHASGSINNLIIPFNEYVYLAFQNLAKPIFDMMVKNKIENQKLSELRDWLLPMLMNGQVKVD